MAPRAVAAPVRPTGQVGQVAATPRLVTVPADCSLATPNTHDAVVPFSFGPAIPGWFV